ncbi:MAG TPA: DUF3137 domain-containing protein [Anaerohalosphaeraceae bacterium]|nr:DUF3137 domain-containing protein [Anaerohalosphaeraceae bacterium]
MKTFEEMKTFYEQALLPDLAVLEQRRKHILRGLGIGLVVLVGVGLFWAGPLFALTEEPAAVIVPLLVTLLLVVGFLVVLGLGYQRDFKERVIRRLVCFLEPGLQYDPKGKIAQEDFLRSELFQTRPNLYRGDDRVWGRVGKTQIEFSEILAQHIQRSGKTTTVHTIFRGLFFIADFSKHFRTKTFVLPDTAERVLGRFGKTLQSLNPARPNLIVLEDPRFEKEFVVYGQDPIEARYILSPSLMERILQFRQKTGRRIFLSFADSKLYLAVWFDRSLFEPKLFQSLLDFQTIQEYFGDIQLAVGVVEDLNLNTRIWSKE